MTKLVDDVARAMWNENDGLEWDEAVAEGGHMAPIVEAYRLSARAAIAVIANYLREPSEEMLEAWMTGFDKHGTWKGGMQFLASHLEEQK